MNNNIQNQIPANTTDLNPITRSANLDSTASSKPNIAQSNYQRIKQEENYSNFILSKLSNTSFAELLNTQSLSSLYNLILEPGEFSNLSIVDQFVIHRQLLVTHFIKPESMPNITESMKDKILTLLSSIRNNDNPSDLLNKLKALNPNLILPVNFNIANYQPRAYQLWTISENLKKIIVEATYNEYFGDILILMKLPDDKYQFLSNKVKELTQKIATSYKPPYSDLPAPPDITTEILGILNDFGRTQIFIKDMKDNNIYGNLVEIVSKLEYAVMITDTLRAKKFSLPMTSENIAQEVKIVMLQNIVLR